LLLYCIIIQSGQMLFPDMSWGHKMPQSTLVSSNTETDQDSAKFYRHVLETLKAANLPFLIGGAYAFNCYTGISRHTKDLDIFIRAQDYEHVSEALLQSGYKTELTYPHWLAKARCNENFIDLIFNSGNGISKVDNTWFDYATEAQVLDVQVKICPVEETIWSKSFIMERERYDGADIVHLLRACASQLDWQRLLQRFGPHWRILLSHLTLFGFVYPAHRNLLPAWVMDTLLERLRDETHTPPPDHTICFGTLISREQYLMDIEQWNYRDARVIPLGNMTARDTATWTEAIQNKDKES
jgi:hypothetical protein